MAKIIKAEAKNLKLPLDGFKSSITDLPEFNLKANFGIPAVKEATDAAKTATDAISSVFKDSEVAAVISSEMGVKNLIDSIPKEISCSHLAAFMLRRLVRSLPPRNWLRSATMPRKIFGRCVAVGAKTTTAIRPRSQSAYRAKPQRFSSNGDWKTITANPMLQAYTQAMSANCLVSCFAWPWSSNAYVGQQSAVPSPSKSARRRLDILHT